MTFHHMQTVQVNCLNEQKDNKHIQPLWLLTQYNAKVDKCDSEVDIGVGSNIYRAIFGERRLKPPFVLISSYGDTLVVNKGSCKTILLIGCQTPRKAKF